MTKLDHPRLQLSEPQENALIFFHFRLFAQAMFCAVHPGQILKWHPFLDMICTKLQDAAEGRIKNLILNIPPRHLKSFLVSEALPAWILGRTPEQHIMCVSYALPLAEELSAGTRRIMATALYKSIFGDCLQSNRMTKQILKTREGGGRRATSLEGSSTGFGANFLIFDDPQKPGEALSEIMRRGSNASFEETFLSRRNPPDTACVIIVMQRIHPDDFVAHAVEKAMGWEVISLPAIAEDDQAFAYHDGFRNRVYRRKAGEALHPERLPLKELEQIRRDLGEFMFETQYQQKPAPAGGTYIKTEWFPRFSPSQQPDRFERIVQSWDTANTTGPDSAYSVCTTWGVKGGLCYLLNVFRKRLLYPDLKAAVIQQQQVHRAGMVFIEDQASGTQLIQQLRGETYGWVQGVKPKGGKEDRMIAQTARIENGKVLLPDSAPWLAEYLYELQAFPNGKYADQVDSTSQALLAIHSPENGLGLLAFAVEQLTAQSNADAELWKMKPPPDGGGTLIDRQGRQHHAHPDGYFYVCPEHGTALLGAFGWERMG